MQFQSRYHCRHPSQYQRQLGLEQAINFGELFLKIYGSGLQREELLKVFANWNISTESAFKKIPQASMHKELANLLSNFKPDLIGKEKKPDAD